MDTFDRYTLGGEYFRWYRGVPVALPVRGRFKAYWSGPARSWWSISRQRTHSISFPPYIVLISHGIFSTSLSLSLCLRRNSIFCLITLAQRERERERRGFLPFLLLPSNSECSDRLRTHLGCVYPLCFSLSLYLSSFLFFFYFGKKLARSRSEE